MDRDPVAAWTVWASKPALSYVAKQIWPLVLSWSVYAQISSIWGQKGGKGIPVHTLLKGTIGVVNICISLQNAQKITEEWEGRVSQICSSKNGSSQEQKPLRQPPPFKRDLYWAVDANNNLLRWKTVNKPLVPRPSRSPSTIRQFG